MNICNFEDLVGGTPQSTTSLFVVGPGWGDPFEVPAHIHPLGGWLYTSKTVAISAGAQRSELEWL